MSAEKKYVNLVRFLHNTLISKIILNHSVSNLTQTQSEVTKVLKFEVNST